MPKKPSKQLRTRLENLFKGVRESTPRTGALSTSRLQISNLEAAGGWVWECNLDGIYTWCSPEVERVLGYRQHDMVGKSLLDTPILRVSAAALEAVFQKREPAQNIKVEAERQDGTRLTLMINALLRTGSDGEPLGFRGVAQVLSYEKTPKPRLAARVPQKPDEINISTSPLLVPTWGSVMGFVDDGEDLRPLEEGAQTSMLNPLVESDRMIIPIRLQDSLMGSIELEENQFGRPWSEDDRELVEGVAEDLALSLQNARSYQLTLQALEEMREADSLKSQFLANMSHELRTPLNSIIGFSRVILKGIDGDINETQEQDLTAIYNAGQHLLGLINDILDISRIEAGKMDLSFEEVDLDEIVRGVMSTAAGLVRDKPIELVTDLPENLPSVHADNMRVRQILLNLVSNAAKFTEKGQIGISASVLKRADQHEILIAVFDTGPGIAPEDHEKLFERFSQVDASATRRAGGTGLGLAITRHLVELQGGRIWVESAQGEGSTFLFTLPLFSSDAPTEEKHLQALCIHDEPVVQEILKKLLEDRLYRVQICDNPVDAPDLAASLQPDLIILDLLEPEQRGLEVIQSLRQHPVTKNTAIVSASIHPELNKAFILDRVDFAIQPFDLPSLEAYIQRWSPDNKTPDLLVLEDESSLEGLQSLLSDAGYITYPAASLQEAAAVLKSKDPSIIVANPFIEDGQGFLLPRTSDIHAGTIPTIFLLPSEPNVRAIALLQHITEQIHHTGLREEAEVLDDLGAIIDSLTDGVQREN